MKESIDKMSHSDFYGEINDHYLLEIKILCKIPSFFSIARE